MLQNKVGNVLSNEELDEITSGIEQELLKSRLVQETRNIAKSA